ncbi:MAG: alpha/beta fold hydrolase [Acidimicrobiales bacterium]
MPPDKLSVTRSGSGPRLVLVHGFTQSSGSWEPVARQLAGFEVVTPDLPGHGQSPPARGGLAGAADALAQACGTGAYVGYSLGARSCLHLALRHPATVERLVLVSATAGIEDEAARNARRAADDTLAARIEMGGDGGMAEFLDEWLGGPLFAHLGPAEANKPSRLVNSAAGLASSLRQCGNGTQLPLWQEVGQLSMPVLVVAGEQDPRYTELGRRLAAAIGSNASYVAAAGRGHAVPFEQPEAFGALVRSFVLPRTAHHGEPAGS